MVRSRAQTPEDVAAAVRRTTGLRSHRSGPRLNTYVDASALVKLFLQEAGSDEIRRLVGGAAIVACSALAIVECRSAFARLEREGLLKAAQRRERDRELDRFWSDVYSIDVDATVLTDASTIGCRHPLRAIDAVHLASALIWIEGDARGCAFACWDARLWDAAATAGFQMVPSIKPWP